ncbi:Cytochrome P450 monooxygenase [Pseudocercospora fuligena]|uniref:Cytochrome P450 monooxygenase n=1 Tax=Pseudocercospora fuligena TaxID=685502 RepID=A0A8H6RP25_9PEZI|nr:Cytochrome P450 monooxygenase [Pseudocercospora fuligena]
MPSYVTIGVALVVVYFSSFVYRFLKNWRNARKSGLPYFFVPLDQNHFIWMIISVPLRPWLKRNLPTWITDRISLCIYGHEFHEGSRQYEVWGRPQGNEDTVVMVTPGLYEMNTRDPELAMEILRNYRAFTPHDLTVLFMARFGQNVLTSNGDDWVRQRKVIASTINERISKTVFNESVHQTAGLLDEVVGEEKQTGESAKIFDYMKKITINVLSGAGMGAKVEWNDNANEKPKPGFKMTYIDAVKVIIDAVAGPIILPKWFLDYYPKSLPGHDLMRSLGLAIDEFPIHTKDLLEAEKIRTTKLGETSSNIMSQLLKASESEKAGLSDDEMMGNLFVFTAAGFDTTANTLSFALVLLSRYPQWQKWMLEEIDQILPSNVAGNELDYVSIFPRATRILAIMFETLRLFPPVIHLAKQTRKPEYLTSNGKTYRIPAKASVYINIVGIHQDPNVWRHLNLPPNTPSSDHDEKIFRPSRWISPENGEFFRPPPGYFIPWSSGPRICPGQKMAQVEFVSIFLVLFRKRMIEAVQLPGEGREEMEERLEKKMRESISILTLQMNDVYNVKGHDDGKGLKLRVTRRR